MATEAQAEIYDTKLPVRDGETIKNWWIEEATGDVLAVVMKLGAYGSLNFHATCMLTMVGRHHASIREGTELAISSYVAGKLNRILESLSRGILPDEDSWADLARYAMMARYVRKHGEWP